MRRLLLLGLALLASLAALAFAVACGYVALPFGLTINFPGFTGAPIPERELASRVTLPPGFHINTYAGGINNARLLRFTPTGDLLVSAPRQGRVILLARDANGDGVADGQRVLLEGLDRPHGLALHQGWLYVAEGSAVLRVRFDAETGSVIGAPQRIVTGLPDGGNHWTRTIGIGPDAHLYVSVGSSCNNCIEDDPRRAAILRYTLDGGGEALYATGLRNAVGFAWQPGTDELYATDNGRDLLGDDFPPCELNRVVAGGFYGWPFAHGDRVPDPSLGAGNEARIAASLVPVFNFGAHTAPLGITFHPGATPTSAEGLPFAVAAPLRADFPPAWSGAAFVAEHGSWNRSKKIGYRVVALHFAADGRIREEAFATGFERDETVYGRPVDVAFGPDGALYVSDDYTGSVYRIGYGAPAAGDAAAAPAAARPDPLAGLDAATRASAAARGLALWNANGCAVCHVAGQAAGDAYRPLADLDARYTLDALATFFTAPQPPMPLYPFDAAQRRDLAVYLLDAYR